VIGTARDLGLKTFVTLHHFTNPIWFADRGGWSAPDSAESFARYARRCGEALGDLLEVVNTINEPSVLAVVGHVMGYFPPRVQDLELSHAVTVNLLKAHAAAAEQIRATSGAQVGVPLSVADFAGVDSSAEAARSRDYLRHWWMGVWIEALRSGRVAGLEVPDEQVPGLGGTDDFVGIQYYSCFVVGKGAEGNASASLPEPSGPDRVPDEVKSSTRRTQVHWAWWPEGLANVIDDVSAAGLPMYITENGIATSDDAERIEYVDRHLEKVHASIERGRDVRGYFQWSLIDNFEWNEGYRPTFGMVAVDRETMERTPKPSLAWYGGVARANSLG
jgi:beta-glucosidase